MVDTDLPLFAWKPPVVLVVFPLANRVGKIRDVAQKMLGKTTDRHSEHYKGQVTDALTRPLEKIGLAETEIADQIDAFWRKVHEEMIRLAYQGHGAGGAV